MTVLLRAMTAADWPAVRDIYAAGIETGDATFETAPPPSWQAWDRSRLPDHRLVAADADGGTLGWVAVKRVSERAAYAGVVEHSVFVATGARGRGVGRALLAALVDSTERAGIWTVQSGIFPENAASLALHQSVGFRIVGRRERIGRLGGRWRDVLLVERRSRIAGR